MSSTSTPYEDAYDVAQAIVERVQCQGANGEEAIRWGAEQIRALLKRLRTGMEPDLMGHVVIDGRHWLVPICYGSPGSAYPYHAFLWNSEGYGDTPEEALMMLREEMLSVAVEDRDTPGTEFETLAQCWVVEK